MSRSHEDDIAPLMHEILDRASEADWAVTAEDVRTGARPRWMRVTPSSPMIAIALSAAAVLIVAVVAGNALTQSSHHPVSVEVPHPTPTPTLPRSVPPPSTTPPPAPPSSTTSEPQEGHIPTSPPATSATPTTATTETVVPKAQTPDCSQGPVAVTVSRPVQAICVQVGSSLTVTFDEISEAGGVPGAWLGPPTVANPSVVSVTSSSTRGTTLTVQLTASSPGSTTVSVNFQEECSGTGTTPCTIPPQGQLVLTVTVVSS